MNRCIAADRTPSGSKGQPKTRESTPPDTPTKCNSSCDKPRCNFVPTRQDGEIELLIRSTVDEILRLCSSTEYAFRRSTLGCRTRASKGHNICPSESPDSQSQHSAGPAKVVAVDRESNGEREQGGAVEGCPEQQTPVLETLATKDAETEFGRFWQTLTDRCLQCSYRVSHFRRLL